MVEYLPPTGGKLHEAQQRKRQCRKNHPATACPAHAKLAFLGFASTHGIEDTEGDGRGNDVAGLMPGLDGAELNAVKELLGHSSLAATQIYTHNTIEKLKDIHKKAHSTSIEKALQTEEIRTLCEWIKNKAIK